LQTIVLAHKRTFAYASMKITVLSLNVHTGTYAIAIGYCVTDVGYEAYKLHNRKYVTEKGEPMTMAQVRTIYTTVRTVLSCTSSRAY
jgi:hypothetical protein